MDESGTGLVSTMAGALVFLGLLLFAVQLLYNLYATSVVMQLATAAPSASTGDGPSVPELSRISPGSEVRRRSGTIG